MRLDEDECEADSAAVPLQRLNQPVRFALDLEDLDRLVRRTRR